MIRKGFVFLTLLLGFAMTSQGAVSQTATLPRAPETKPAVSQTTGLQRTPQARPSAPATIRQRPNPANPANGCVGSGCEEEPEHITVVNAPPQPAPVPVWPMHARISWAANLVLVLLAYAALLMGLTLLRKIERQTKVCEEAAAAATESSQAVLMHVKSMVDAERPWILVDVEADRAVENGFVVTATNRGRSPARIESSDDAVAFAADEAGLAASPEYGEAKPFVPLILLPGERTVIKAFSRGDVKELCGTEERLKKVEEWAERIYLFGRVEYRDLISPRDEQTHETTWCCWYIHGRQKSGLVTAGPRPYHMHT